jgi:hypothetical protein
MRAATWILSGWVVAVLFSAGAWAQTEGTLTVTVRTKTTRKRFAPRHVLAIWVTDDKGTFVRTLKVCAKRYGKYLRKWQQSTKGNRVDAVTSASLRAHGKHTVTWDGRDVEGKAAPDGTYRIQVEFTEVNDAGPFTPPGHLYFVKGPKPLEGTVRPLRYFDEMTVVWKPAGEPNADRRMPNAE